MSVLTRLTFKCDFNWIIGLGEGGGGNGGLNEIFLQTKSYRVNPGCLAQFSPLLFA